MHLLAPLQSWHSRIPVVILTFLLYFLHSAIHLVPSHSAAFPSNPFGTFTFLWKSSRYPHNQTAESIPLSSLTVTQWHPNSCCASHWQPYSLRYTLTVTLLQFSDTIIVLFLATLYSLLALIVRPPHRPHGSLTGSLTGTRTVLLALSLALSPGDHSQMSGLHPYGLRTCHLH